MRGNYNTRQKDIIVSAVETFGGKHFTAEEMYDSLRGKDENIGISTVYRNLDKMVESGEIKKFTLAGEKACYQSIGCRDSHFHLKCIECGKLEHLSCDHLDEISTHVKEKHGFVIDSTRTVFYGLCKNCKENNK